MFESDREFFKKQEQLNLHRQGMLRYLRMWAETCGAPWNEELRCELVAQIGVVIRRHAEKAKAQEEKHKGLWPR